MDVDLEHLARAVLRLPAPVRAELATRLLASLEPDAGEDSPEAVSAAWEAELARREAELDADPSIAIPADEVFRRVEAALAARPRAGEGGT